MTNILTKAVNRVMSLWGREETVLVSDHVKIGFGPTKTVKEIKSGLLITEIDCKVISIKDSTGEWKTGETSLTFIGDEPLSGMDMPKSDAVTFIKEIPALRKAVGLREDSGGPPTNVMIVTQMNLGGVLFPGTYRSRRGQRVLYSGRGAGRFLPYGLETGGWNPATGRWLTSGEDHIRDLMKRIEQGEE